MIISVTSIVLYIICVLGLLITLAQGDFGTAAWIAIALFQTLRGDYAENKP